MSLSEIGNRAFHHAPFPHEYREQHGTTILISRNVISEGIGINDCPLKILLKSF